MLPTHQTAIFTSCLCHRSDYCSLNWCITAFTLYISATGHKGQRGPRSLHAQTHKHTHTNRDLDARDCWRAWCECDLPGLRFLRLSDYIAVCQAVMTQRGDGPSECSNDWRGHTSGTLGGLTVQVQVTVHSWRRSKNVSGMLGVVLLIVRLIEFHRLVTSFLFIQYC